MYSNIFHRPKNQAQKILIEVSSGYPPALYPLVNSDLEQRQLCEQMQQFVKDGTLLHALEGLGK